MSFNPLDTNTSFFDDTITPSTSGNRSIKRHPLFRSQDEDALGERVGDHGPTGHQRHAAAAACWLSGLQVQDVVIADAVLDEEALVIARCAECAVRKLDRGEAGSVGGPRIRDPQFPRPIVSPSADVQIAAGLDHEIVQATVTEDPDRSIDRITLADSAKMRAHPFPLQKRRAGRLVQFE